MLSNVMLQEKTLNDIKKFFYIFNLSLIFFFVVTFFLAHSFFQVLIDKAPKESLFLGSEKFESSNNFQKIVVPISQLYKNRDVFGLFLDTEKKMPAKDLTSSVIPKLVLPEIKPPEPEKPVAFIDPLPISLNAIILSSEADSSVCVISDETDKEVIYHVGDRVKDASLIKILRDNVVFLRLNGQFETYYLHSNSLVLPKSPVDAVVKKDDNHFVVDKAKFVNSIQNFGSFLDYFENIPFLDEDGVLVGFVVTEKDEKNLARMMGFNEFDLILSIDGITFESNKNRMAAYDHVVKKSEEENVSFEVEFSRDNNLMKNVYSLTSSALGSPIEKTEISATSATFELINKQPSEKRKSLSGLVTFPKDETVNIAVNNDSINLQKQKEKEEKIFVENLKAMREAMVAKQNAQIRNS